MVSLREESSVALSVETRFETALPQLFEELEQWRRECRAESPARDDFPATDWKAMGQGMIFFGVCISLTYILPAVRIEMGWLAKIWLYTSLTTMVVSGITACYLLFIRSQRADTAQFWLALRESFMGEANFPFSIARELLDRDLRATERLRSHSHELLSAAKDRLSVSEETIRSRLNILIGNPSILVLAGLFGAVGSSWQNFHKSDSALSLALLAASIGAFGLALYGSKLQLSLVELARCRALISLEISRRTCA